MSFTHDAGTSCKALKTVSKKTLEVDDTLLSGVAEMTLIDKAIADRFDYTINHFGAGGITKLVKDESIRHGDEDDGELREEHDLSFIVELAFPDLLKTSTLVYGHLDEQWAEVLGNLARRRLPVKE
ncbi:protein of unknown function [Candidatus Methylomirabilis oxygeniifera]|uniref:Uncharacterized protein n=1 Tax=Methylomirabilis oxygeniifera TaxID=671143 RepID=D5MKM8_METO1|nr:protein of unknown function [Candidatus Methylomirabilis oxyfera]